MPPKRPATSPAMSPSTAKKKRKSLTLKVKLDIIHRHEERNPFVKEEVACMKVDQTNNTYFTLSLSHFNTLIRTQSVSPSVVKEQIAVMLLMVPSQPQ
ncbi:hypothetical protein E2C01_075375 [Portunus trituberculatus]|uniref:HTH psq-type domain-containing protein n=1 Tax=Portunus trituberculatus TaxID=210409 RepID=A0A5B7IAJ5_PORTR|nr:hypothetical protein [Portunus trituberculatus]